jgi:hypothetical protein
MDGIGFVLLCGFVLGFIFLCGGALDCSVNGYFLYLISVNNNGWNLYFYVDLC